MMPVWVNLQRDREALLNLKSPIRQKSVAYHVITHVSPCQQTNYYSWQQHSGEISSLLESKLQVGMTDWTSGIRQINAPYTSESNSDVVIDLTGDIELKVLTAEEVDEFFNNNGTCEVTCSDSELSLRSQDTIESIEGCAEHKLSHAGSPKTFNHQEASCEMDSVCDCDGDKQSV